MLGSPNGRSDAVAQTIDGKRLRTVEALGKHLFYVFGADTQLHIHLGRFGNFHEGELPLPEIRGILRLRLWNAKRWLELRGAITIEVIDRAQRARIGERIGSDPLDDDADPALAYAKIVKSRSPIGLLLMDQSVVSGIGNIYRSELLFRHGVHPRRPGNAVSRATWNAMWRDMRTLMDDAVVRGRIVTTDPAERRYPKRANVASEDRFYAYHRAGKPCRRCGTTILTDTIATRNVYWCPKDQPE